MIIWHFGMLAKIFHSYRKPHHDDEYVTMHKIKFQLFQPLHYSKYHQTYV